MIKIDPQSFVPIYEQVKNQIKRQIGMGFLRPNQVIPSIRDLAIGLLINPNTVARAYRELEKDGFIYTQKGKGSYVSALSPAMIEKERIVSLNQLIDEAIAEGLKFNIPRARLMQIFGERLSSIKKEKELTKNE